MNNEEALGKLTEKVLKVCKEQFKTLEKYVDSLEDLYNYIIANVLKSDLNFFDAHQVHLYKEIFSL